MIACQTWAADSCYRLRHAWTIKRLAGGAPCRSPGRSTLQLPRAFDTTSAVQGSHSWTNYAPAEAPNNQAFGVKEQPPSSSAPLLRTPMCDGPQSPWTLDPPKTSSMEPNPHAGMASPYGRPKKSAPMDPPWTLNREPALAEALWTLYASVPSQEQKHAKALGPLHLPLPEKCRARQVRAR